MMRVLTGRRLRCREHRFRYDRWRSTEGHRPDHRPCMAELLAEFREEFDICSNCRRSIALNVVRYHETMCNDCHHAQLEAEYETCWRQRDVQYIETYWYDDDRDDFDRFGVEGVYHSDELFTEDDWRDDYQLTDYFY